MEFLGNPLMVGHNNHLIPHFAQVLDEVLKPVLVPRDVSERRRLDEERDAARARGLVEQQRRRLLHLVLDLGPNHHCQETQEHSTHTKKKEEAILLLATGVCVRLESTVLWWSKEEEEEELDTPRI
jgi:hypothetical protein